MQYNTVNIHGAPTLCYSASYWKYDMNGSQLEGLLSLGGDRPTCKKWCQICR
jgi:hypothetical protein